MRRHFLLILAPLQIFSACDCQYHLSGVVLDKLTMKPIQGVTIGKTDTTDLDNPFNRKTTTAVNGSYEIYGVAGKCNKITMFFTKDGYKTKEISFSNNSADTILLQSLSKPYSSQFDSNKDFKILELRKSNDYPSSDTDTTACFEWTLSRPELKSIIKGTTPINGPEWHHLFGHYPCRIHGKILQGTITYNYSINSGGWLRVSSPDTNLLFGNFKDENNKYFLDSAWTEE